MYRMNDKIINANERKGGGLFSNIRAAYFREGPPGDFRDTVVGYSMKGMSGYFGLRVGYKVIRYLLPTNVRVDLSRSGSVYGANRTWRPHFVSVTVAFTRLGKIFSNDIYNNLLFEAEMNSTGPTDEETLAKSDNNIKVVTS